MEAPGVRRRCTRAPPPPRTRRPRPRTWSARPPLSGRCFHSSTSHSTLDVLPHSNTEITNGIPQKFLTLSRKVDECNPLRSGCGSSAHGKAVQGCRGVSGVC